MAPYSRHSTLLLNMAHRALAKEVHYLGDSVTFGMQPQLSKPMTQHCRLTAERRGGMVSDVALTEPYMSLHISTFTIYHEHIKDDLYHSYLLIIGLVVTVNTGSGNIVIFNLLKCKDAFLLTICSQQMAEQQTSHPYSSPAWITKENCVPTV